jgi:NADH-quinone oxidoreductase subunit C
VFRFDEKQGVIEVFYILRSIRHNHRPRVAASTDDSEPRLPSVTRDYETTNFHEREVHDFFGVQFAAYRIDSVP